MRIVIKNIIDIIFYILLWWDTDDYLVWILFSYCSWRYKCGREHIFNNILIFRNTLSRELLVHLMVPGCCGLKLFQPAAINKIAVKIFSRLKGCFKPINLAAGLWSIHEHGRPSLGKGNTQLTPPADILSANWLKLHFQPQKRVLVILGRTQNIYSAVFKIYDIF